jgi:lipopolysaccharide biosynthesis regulator YciM
VLDKIEQSFLAIGDKKGCYDFLTQLAADSQATKTLGVSFVVKYSLYLEQFEDAQRALNFVLTSLEQNPNIRAFAQLLELESQTTDSDKAAEQFKRIKTLVNQYLASKPLYECRNCGFSSKLHYWLCPSCQTWGSSKPLMA